MNKFLNVLKAALTVLFVVSRDILFWLADKVVYPVLSSLPDSKPKQDDEDEPDWTNAGIDPTYCEYTGKKFDDCKDFDYRG